MLYNEEITKGIDQEGAVLRADFVASSTDKRMFRFLTFIWVPARTSTAGLIGVKRLDKEEYEWDIGGAQQWDEQGC